MSKLYDDVVQFIADQNNNAETTSTDWYDDYTSLENTLMNSEYADDIKEMFATVGIDFTSVDSHGGEGQGDEFCTVYKFTRNDEMVYIAFSGWYSSYEGATYDEMNEVFPKEVTRTEYVTKENL
jgi:hypothetical protein